MDNTEAFTISTDAYQVTGDNRGALVAVGDNAYSTTNQGIAIDATSTDQQFAIVKNNEQYYLFSISAQKFVNKGEDKNAVLSTIGEPVRLVYKDNTYWQIYFGDYRLNFGGSNGNMAIDDYGANGNQEDQGNKFDIVSVGDASASVTAALAMTMRKNKQVTFQVKYGESIVASSPHWIIIGTESVLPDDLKRDYCTYTYDVNTVSESTSTVTATATFDGPFEVSASFANATWYFMKINGKYTSWDETNKKCPDVSEKSVADNAQWAFVGNPYDGFMIYNKSKNENFTLEDMNGGKGTVVQMTETTTGKNQWNVKQNGTSFQLYTDDKKYLNDDGSNSCMIIWDGASNMSAEAVPIAELTNVTYNIIYNDSQVATATVQQYTGEAPELPGSLNLTGLCNYDVPTTPITENAEYNVTATWVGPFNFSASYEEADWKNIRLRRNANDLGYYKYLNYDSTTEPYTNIFASETQRATDEYQWAFLGNPYAVKIINKARGKNYSLTLIGNNLVLRENVDGMSIAKSTTGFAIVVRDANGTITTTINDNQNKLGVWGGSHATDEGSDLIIVDVPEPDYAAAVTTDIKPWMDIHGQLFGIKEDVYTTNKSTYEAALTTCNKTTYNALKAIVDNVENLIYPETGYYRVESKSKPGYWLQWEEPANYSNDNTGVKFVQNGNTSASSVVRFEKEEGSVNKYAIKIQGKYLGAPDKTGDNEEKNTWQGRTSTQNDTPHYYTFEVKTPGQVTFRGATTGDQNDYSYAQCADGQNNCFVTWSYETKSEMSIVPVADINITIGSAGYATTYLPFAVSVPTGVTAYKGKINDSYVSLTDVGNTIPAETGVVLKGNAGTYTFGIAESAEAVAGNNLIGTLVNKAAVANDYALANKDNVVGFYRIEDDVTIPANKAYINVPSGGSVKGFTFAFDDEATGIEKTLSNSSLKGENIYNLAGQRLGKMQKGVNIVNGKKILY